MAGFSVIGKSVPRVDAVVKATGQAIYTTDIKLPGMLHAKALRSPYPHARIINIDTSKAEQLPGVACVVTSQDAPKVRYGEYALCDQTVLALDVVRAIGEPVAAVAAETIDIAEEAVELIDVKYEKLPAIFDAEESMSTNPPVVIHPDLFQYPYAIPTLRMLDADRPNVFAHYKIRKGDIDKGFQQSDLVMENRFTVPMSAQGALELFPTVVQPEADGGLTVWTSKHVAHPMRTVLSMIFGIKPSKIRVIEPYIGGCFGRGSVREEALVVLLALKAGRPVKQVFTREEAFYRGGLRNGTIIYLKDGVKKDGTLVAREVTYIQAAGSYAAVIDLTTRNSAFGAVGSYRLPNLKWDSYGVYLNNPLAVPYRGFGTTQVLWAVEQHMDMLAEKLGINPVEIRRKNLLREGDENATGEITHSIGAAGCLDKVVKFLEPDKKPESNGIWRRGKGISVSNKYSQVPPTHSTAMVRVLEDDSIQVWTGAEEVGQGCDTAMAQIAAEEFGISVDQVRIALTDTDSPAYDFGAISSRQTYHCGNAVKLACQDAKRKLFEVAAEKLHVSPEELDTREARVYLKDKPETWVYIHDLFILGLSYVTEKGEIIGIGTFAHEFVIEDLETGQIDPKLAAEGKRLNPFYDHGAKVLEIAVNTETGEIKVLKAWTASDMGQPINPKICEQQEDGGLGMGIGIALEEEVILENGRVANANFCDYRIASVGEMPTIDNMKSFHAPAIHKDGPFGAKGIAEGVLVGIDAAIANALYNAVGVRIKDAPLTAEKVLKAIKAKESDV